MDSYIWTIEFKDEENESIITHKSMTTDQAISLMNQFIDRGIDAKFTNISEISSEDDLDVKSSDEKRGL